MSNDRKMCLIKDLKPYRDEWRLTLKLLHSWKQSTSFSGDTLECVLVDQTGAKIQASCKRWQMNREQRYLPVGEWKVVDTVKITGAGRQYRPTKQQYKMTILGDTSITPSDYRNDNQFLDLANYEEIVNGKLKPNFLIDIMGQVTDLGAVATVQAKGNDTKRVHFRLRDLSGQEVSCCLWGKYAEQIETHMEEANDETFICLIRFAKISEFRGEVQITNAFDASLVCLNPTMEEAIDFRQKMSSDSLALAICDQSNEKKIITKVTANWDDVDVRCISEILQSFESEKPQFYCDVYRGPCNNYEPKFKLHLIVKDDTETCRLMLLDTVGRTIIGSKAVELWDGSFDELPGIDHINENSSEDFSTPSNKRKEDECDQMDMTSTSKKLCTKIVKKEKEKD
ncbi:hypothetical protein HID58_023329 [Brassica napus]|uniref:DUF223 domain-containing protein n=1 Tax=Brassica napus TaxID=3708 RepID=A0ABQ8D1S6_BRANA|nr:hypothetical protein HID58_023329 [Brassica napus]